MNEEESTDSGSEGPFSFEWLYLGLIILAYLIFLLQDGPEQYQYSLGETVRIPFLSTQGQVIGQKAFLGIRSSEYEVRLPDGTSTYFNQSELTPVQ